jgi:hypothetical protein
MNLVTKYKIGISVVLYNTSNKDVNNLITSFKLIECPYNLYIVDNSPSSDWKTFFEGMSNIQYRHNPLNPGFGASHNLAIKDAIETGCDYHFIVNPDVYFLQDVVSPMAEFMHDNPQVGMVMPQIVNLDGSIQFLPKLLPSPYSIIMRKLKKPKFLYEDFINEYELRNIPKDKVYEAPVLSGCFTLLKLEAIKEVGAYDDNFFMYFEDWDLSRRVNAKFKTIYFPKVSVYHGYDSGANKNKRLFKIFINSALHYFNKWGYVFDSERNKINLKTLSQFR